MPINCPYCQHSVTIIRGGKSGRFFPRCSKCQRKYILIVPEDPRQQLIAQSVQDAADAGDTVTPDIAVALGLSDDEKPVVSKPPPIDDELGEDDDDTSER